MEWETLPFPQREQMRKKLNPSPQLYSNAATFFADFIKINKEENSNFSHRLIASKLKWPVSYISDIIAGRKVLTLPRVLQFSDFYKMNSFDRERLIWFALAESENDEVKSFFHKKLHLSSKDVLKPAIPLKDANLYNTLAAVCAFLILKKHRMSASEIMEQIYLPYLTTEKIAEALSEIDKNHYLVWNSQGELITNNADFVFDNFSEDDGEPFVNLELHHETAKSFLHFLKHPKSPSVYQSGIIQLRKGQFMTLALQIISLRNQFIEISQENVVSATAKENENYRLMQFDFNFFPVTELS